MKMEQSIKNQYFAPFVILSSKILLNLLLNYSITTSLRETEKSELNLMIDSALLL